MTAEYLPVELYTTDQIKQLEQLAIDKFSISEDKLMARAGQAAFQALCDNWPEARRITVFCGPGNNGGDGFVFARLAQEAGYRVHVWVLGDQAKLSEVAAQAKAAAEETNVPMDVFDPDAVVLDADVYVDALLGTGLQRDVGGDFAAAIALLNEQEEPILAIDVPSGLNADLGHVCGDAVMADLTVTFIGLKPGLLTAQGSNYIGELLCDDLGIPREAFAEVEEAAYRLVASDIAFHLDVRDRDAHKGEFGHVLVIGGNDGMPGSVRLAGEAAYRVGAGLVTVATRASHALHVTSACPELMCYGVEKASELAPLLEQASVVVLGPGLGQDDWAKALFHEVIRSENQMVIDADALNLLAQEPCHSSDWILTPHPGEAARLLNTTTHLVQADRFQAVKRLNEQYGGVSILKGAGTLVINSEGLALCDAGNPGMASGGMGDILSGILGGLVAQGLTLDLAAQVGVTVHAYAGDCAAEEGGERGLLASDLMPWLRQLVN